VICGQQDHHTTQDEFDGIRQNKMARYAGRGVLTTSFVDDLDTDTSGRKGVPLLLSHL
jgi:hypothetical protein